MPRGHVFYRPAIGNASYVSRELTQLLSLKGGASVTLDILGESDQVLVAGLVRAFLTDSEVISGQGMAKGNQCNTRYIILSQ